MQFKKAIGGVDITIKAHKEHKKEKKKEHDLSPSDRPAGLDGMV